MKTFWIILVTVIVAGGLAGGGTYGYLNNKANSDKKNIQTQIDYLNNQVIALNGQLSLVTTDWKTYTNTTYNFTFKYPSTWVLHEGAILTPSEVLTLDSNDGISEQAKNPTNSLIFTHYNSMSDFDASWSGSKNATTIDEFIQNENYTKVGTKNIGGIDSTEFLEGSLGGNNFNIAIKNNNGVLLIQSIGKDQLPAIESEVLSTFQFTK